MHHNNNILEGVTSEFKRCGISYTLEREKNGYTAHYTKGVNGHSEPRVFYIGLAQGHHERAVADKRSELRKQLAADGLLKPTAPAPTIQIDLTPLENKIAELSKNLEALTDLMLGYGGKLDALLATPVVGPETIAALTDMIAGIDAKVAAPPPPPPPPIVAAPPVKKAKTQFETVFEAIPFGDNWTTAAEIKRRSMLPSVAYPLNFLKGKGFIENQPNLGWRRTALYRKNPAVPVRPKGQTLGMTLLQSVPFEWTPASCVYKASTVPGNLKHLMRDLREKGLVERKGSRKFSYIRRVRVET